MDLKEKVNGLPSSPGVYLMKDSLDNIIYVGKSKNLKSRVGSYFHSSKHHSPKIEKLVKNLKDFDYILTDTEFEAFILECKLIREIKPRYNRKMKNPLSYCFIKIDLNEIYPSIEVANDFIKENGLFYYGPYTSRSTVENAIDSIKEFYKILCSSKSKKSSACLNFSLGTCLGICTGSEEIREQYNLIVMKFIRLLTIRDMTLIQEIEHRMNSAAEDLDFENASKYRDYINTVNYLLSGAQLIEFAEENNNIVLLEYLNKDSFKIFLIKKNNILFSKRYDISEGIESLKNTLMENILFYFSDKIPEGSKEVLRDEIDEVQIVYSYMKNSLNNCHYSILPTELNGEEIAKIIDNLLEID